MKMIFRKICSWKKHKVLLAVVCGLICLGTGLYTHNAESSLTSLIQQSNFELHKFSELYFRYRDGRVPTEINSNETSILTKPTVNIVLSTILQQKILQRFEERNQLNRRHCEKERAVNLTVASKAWLRPFAAGSFQWCEIRKVASSFLLHFTQDIGPRIKDGRIAITSVGNGARVFMVVREPYSRTVSAYIDRILTFPLSWSRHSKHAIEMYRPNATEKEKRCGNFITFPEFIKYVLYTQKNKIRYDWHFAPMSSTCDPCKKDFHYILHLETLIEDFSYLLNSINITQPVHLDIESRLITGKVNNYINDSRAMHCESICESYKKLWWTFQARGLISRSLPFPLNQSQCDNPSAVTKFANSCWDAHIQSRDKINKHEAIRQTVVELFLGVPLRDRLEFRDFLERDFTHFGYHDTPPDLFPELVSVVH